MIASSQHPKLILRAKLKSLRAERAHEYQAIEGTDGFWAWLDTLMVAANLRTPLVVGGYMPMDYENNPHLMMSQLSHMGWQQSLCVMRNDDLIFRHYDPSLNGLTIRAYGIQEPGEESGIKEPDLIFVPLLGFDAGFHRLGYGKGFYDRTIIRMRREKPCWFIGLAQNYQKVETVYPDEHDQALDGILTPDHFWLRDHQKTKQ